MDKRAFPCCRNCGLPATLQEHPRFYCSEQCYIGKDPPAGYVVTSSIFSPEICEEAKHNTAKFRVHLRDPSGRVLVVLNSLVPNGVIEDETHRTITQTFIVVQGSGMAVVGGITHPLKEGTMLIVPAGTEHRVEASKDKSLKMISIYSKGSGDEEPFPHIAK